MTRTGGVGGKRKGPGRKPTSGKRRSVGHRKRRALDGKNHPIQAPTIHGVTTLIAFGCRAWALKTGRARADQLSPQSSDR